MQQTGRPGAPEHFPAIHTFYFNENVLENNRKHLRKKGHRGLFGPTPMKAKALYAVHKYSKIRQVQWNGQTRYSYN